MYVEYRKMVQVNRAGIEMQMLGTDMWTWGIGDWSELGNCD